MKMQNALDLYNRYLEISISTSMNTVKSYTSDIVQFVDFLEKASGTEPELTDFSSANVRRYLLEIYKTCKKRSIARKISSLSSFGEFLLERKLISINPMFQVGRPSIKSSLHHPISVDETFSLLSAVDTSDKFGIRDLLIMEFLYGSGLRRSELVALDINSVLRKESGDFIQVKSGKGSKDRVIPMSFTSSTAYDEYMRTRVQFSPSPLEKALFLNRYGKRLSDRSIATVIEKYRNICGLGSDVTPHTLRHCFATHLLDSGADLRAIQMMLGHENLSTTQIYTQVSMQKLMEVYDRTHPKA
ncbi:MAG: tyrosine recombinase XerC [Deltaproteobacteria bacterium]|nr:tyrosine recombinase XerC [Deltaproteobacteria bacterium]